MPSKSLLLPRLTAVRGTQPWLVRDCAQSSKHPAWPHPQETVSRQHAASARPWGGGAGSFPGPALRWGLAPTRPRWPPGAGPRPSVASVALPGPKEQNGLQDQDTLRSSSGRLVGKAAGQLQGGGQEAWSQAPSRTVRSAPSWGPLPSLRPLQDALHPPPPEAPVSRLPAPPLPPRTSVLVHPPHQDGPSPWLGLASQPPEPHQVCMAASLTLLGQPLWCLCAKTDSSLTFRGLPQQPGL